MKIKRKKKKDIVLRSIIRQAIEDVINQEAFEDVINQENFGSEKKFFTDVFVKKLDKATLRDQLINIGHRISDLWGCPEARFEAYRAELFNSGEKKSTSAVWSHDEMGECGFILIKAEPYKAQQTDPTYYAIFRVEVDASTKMFYLDIKNLSESPHDILNKFNTYK